MTEWQPMGTAPKDGSSVLLWARLRAYPPEPTSYFEVVGYYHSGSGIERWKSRESDEDLEADCWASILKRAG